MSVTHVDRASRSTRWSRSAVATRGRRAAKFGPKFAKSEGVFLAQFAVEGNVHGGRSRESFELMKDLFPTRPPPFAPRRRTYAGRARRRACERRAAAAG